MILINISRCIFFFWPLILATAIVRRGTVIVMSIHHLLIRHSHFQLSRYTCWMGIIEMQRMFLVIFYMVITDKVYSILIMTFICMLAVALEMAIKLYKSPILNHLSLISISCQVMVAIMSFYMTSVNEALEQGNEYFTEAIIWVINIQNSFSMLIHLSL